MINSSLPPTNSGNILIVDDKPENLRVLDQMLTRRGYVVRKAINGNFALRSSQSNPPDVILLDILMPEMDGYIVCQKLKKNPETAQIPIIFLSALDEVFNKVKAFEVGGTDYITKPFQEEEVLARIKNQLVIQQHQRELQAEIIKRQEMEEILCQSRALINSVLNTSRDGIAVCQAVRDIEGTIGDFRCVLVNPVISKILGIKKENLLNKLFLKKFLHRFKSDLFDKFVQVVETGEYLEDDFYYEANNEHCWYHFIAVPLADGFAINIRDINERKIMELNLQETNAELEAFGYSISHDLKNPLNTIYLLTGIFKSQYSPLLNQEVEFTKLIELLEKSAQNITNIIDGLMALSNIKKCLPNFDRVNLIPMIKYMFNQLKNNEPERNAELIIHASEIIVYGDEKLLTIALQNIIGNSWKYSSKQEKTVIEVGVCPVKDNPDFCNNCYPSCPIQSSPIESTTTDHDYTMTVCFIKDYGAGFDMTKADRLFSPFQRFHSDKEYKGSGIGLSIVQRIIHRHQGSIWCESQVNQGTTFYLALPLPPRHPHLDDLVID